ncbi:MAG: thiamine pyrophosphate-binding protein [Deltaproteobacteria bacterium]|nr:thiamine pyrophosphate-binding protein [Deltaproteobacteria bacterium]
MGYVQGGRIVADALKAEGVSHLFTLCGGHIDAIYQGCHDLGIRVVDFRHEQSAAHTADGWARATGRPGVAAVTAGPGVTDAVTAVANAYRAQVPMVLIGGQGPRLFADMGSLQDMNHVELMRPITKWAVSVPETRRLGEYVQSALRVATQGVPGPVFLEMPLDVLMNTASEDEVVAYPGYRSEARVAPDPAYLAEAARLVSAAERPMLIVGSQIRWSSDPQALARLLESHPLPTFLSGMARGLLPASHPALLQRVRRQALAEADLIFVLGTPLDFRLGYGKEGLAFAPGAKVIQVDLDGTEIGRNRPIDVGLVGDSGLTLAALHRALGEGGASGAAADFLGRLKEADAGKIAKMSAERDSDASPINPLRLCAELDARLDDDAIVVGDGGDFVATAAYNLELKTPFSWLDPGPLGTLGVGPGYAMAAKLAHPDRQVVIVFGDGSFGLNGMEVEAMVRQGIDVKMVIGNDACWTQIARAQRDMYGEERMIATPLSYARYDQVAQGLGGHGEWVEAPEEIGPALDRAFAADRAAVVNVKIGASDFRKGAISV